MSTNYQEDMYRCCRRCFGGNANIFVLSNFLSRNMKSHETHACVTIKNVKKVKENDEVQSHLLRLQTLIAWNPVIIHEYQ